MPDPVAAELYDLWKAGAISLPLVAEVYAAAAGGAHDTGEDGKDETAFDRSSHSDAFDVFGRARETMFPRGKVYPIWTELRDTLNTVLAKSAENLYDTGEALVTVSEQFAAEDADAAADLEELQRKHLDSEELDQPPSRRLVPPMPDVPPRPDDDVAPPFPGDEEENVAPPFRGGDEDNVAPPFN